ncbi:MAG: hypothetical protein GVY05_08960 [Bacteroidetes bacterium]|jgi:hypothetical protein|nr:hypothetical protein [Bacteroidota bacterium]
MKKENPFKKLGAEEEKAPDDIKKNVMEGVAFIELMKDFSSLFTANFATSISSLFKTQNNDDETKNH